MNSSQQFVLGQIISNPNITDAQAKRIVNQSINNGSITQKEATTIKELLGI